MNRVVSKRWAVYGAGAVAVLLLIAVIRALPGYVAAHRELGILRQQQAAIAQRATDLDTNQAYYQSAEYREKQARLQLNYKKPDERVVYIYDRAVTPSPTPLADVKHSWLQWIGEKLGLRD